MAKKVKLPSQLFAKDITFKEMSEEEAVKVFAKDGYNEYQKRRVRYNDNLSSASIWANTPATMFVAFYQKMPVGVVGFSKYKDVLLGAGVHVRREARKKGLGNILIDKIIEEKGGKTLYINIANHAIASSYRKKGFKDMNKEELPQEIQDELKGVDGYADQVQKFLIHTPYWFSILRV